MSPDCLATPNTNSIPLDSNICKDYVLAVSIKHNYSPQSVAGFSIVNIKSVEIAKVPIKN